MRAQPSENGQLQKSEIEVLAETGQRAWHAAPSSATHGLCLPMGPPASSPGPCWSQRTSCPFSESGLRTPGLLLGEQFYLAELANSRGTQPSPHCQQRKQEQVGGAPPLPVRIHADLLKVREGPRSLPRPTVPPSLGALTSSNHPPSSLGPSPWESGHKPILPGSSWRSMGLGANLTRGPSVLIHVGGLAGSEGWWRDHRPGTGELLWQKHQVQRVHGLRCSTAHLSPSKCGGQEPPGWSWL